MPERICWPARQGDVLNCACGETTGENSCVFYCNYTPDIKRQRNSDTNISITQAASRPYLCRIRIPKSRWHTLMKSAAHIVCRDNDWKCTAREVSIIVCYLYRTNHYQVNVSTVVYFAAGYKMHYVQSVCKFDYLSLCFKVSWCISYHCLT